MHDCLPEGLLLDCVVSHVLTRSGGGHHYCLVFLSQTEINSDLAPVFSSSSSIAPVPRIPLSEDVSGISFAGTDVARIRAAALAKAAESGVDNKDGRFGKFRYSVEEAQKAKKH